MSISDAQFQRWLFRDERRCVLVEAVAYSGGAEVTRYVSNCAYVTRPTDTPANIAYDDVLIESPSFSSRLGELFTGRSVPDWGDLVLTNENGERDAWFADAWDGRRVRIYLGDPAWPRGDFRLILDGVIADIGSPQRDRIALKISDKSWMLNVPAQTTLIGGTTANANQPTPICLGQCFNVEPVLVDAPTRRYRVHEGQIEDVTDVRDAGVSVAYTKDLANGDFLLTSAPAGQITCDVKGAKPSGTYLTTAAQFVNYLVTTHSQLTAADIDSTNLSAFAATQTLGLYIRERENLLDKLDQILTSVGGFWTFSRAGLLQLGRLTAPTGAAVLALTADDVRAKKLSIERRDLPIASVRLGYAKNWTVQTEGLAGAVSAANRALYGAPYQVVKAEDASLDTTHKLARRPDVRETLIVGSSDAQTEATRLQALFGVPRTVYRAIGYMAPYTRSLGDELALTHPRFGFEAGADAINVGIVEEVMNNRITVELWK